MKNSDRFLNAFSSIEVHLRKIMSSHRGIPFYQVIDQACKTYATVRMCEYDLKEFGDLRNAIVHERTDGHVIAEPNDQAVAKIQAIEALITNPLKVTPMFQTTVLTLTGEDPIAGAVLKMFENNFSQIPIYSDNTFTGLLTGTTIARWLGAQVSLGIVDLEDTPIEDVLKHGEYANNYIFIPREATLAEVIESFHNREHVEDNLEALLITESGTPEQKLLGIITSWNLSGIHQAISV